MVVSDLVAKTVESTSFCVPVSGVVLSPEPAASGAEVSSSLGVPVSPVDLPFHNTS